MKKTVRFTDKAVLNILSMVSDGKAENFSEAVNRLCTMDEVVRQNVSMPYLSHKETYDEYKRKHGLDDKEAHKALVNYALMRLEGYNHRGVSDASDSRTEAMK